MRINAGQQLDNLAQDVPHPRCACSEGTALVARLKPDIGLVSSQRNVYHHPVLGKMRHVVGKEVERLENLWVLNIAFSLTPGAGSCTRACISVMGTTLFQLMYIKQTYTASTTPGHSVKY